MSENDKIQTLKDSFTKSFTEWLEMGLTGENLKFRHTFFKPKNYSEFKISLMNMVGCMSACAGFVDHKRIGRFELAEVGDELGVRINHHIILERERLQYEDRFVYVMFDVIKYVVENLMDIDEVMMITHCDDYDSVEIWEKTLVK